MPEVLQPPMQAAGFEGVTEPVVITSVDGTSTRGRTAGFLPTTTVEV